MKRRDFLKTIAAVGLASTVTKSSQLYGIDKQAGLLSRRPLGKTGENLSIIGFPGIALKEMEQKKADKLVSDAVEAGVNYFDVAPTYGNSEEILGPALEPFRRNVFLACKSAKRMGSELTEEMHISFRKLKTDHFDLYQLHALTSLDDIKTAFGSGGALEAVTKAKKEGKIRYIGFSAHSVEAAMEALENYDFDSILFPVNFATWYKGNFGKEVVSYAKNRGAGVLAIKSMAFSRWKKGAVRTHSTWYEPLTNIEEANLGLRFTLSLPVTAAVPPGDEELFRLALRLAPSFIPLTQKEKSYLEKKSAEAIPVFEYPSDKFNII
ncbi:aldo/keto reductase [candidate division KSB1 bacterium]